METINLSLTQRRSYPGAVMNFLLSSDSANQVLSVVEMIMIPGSEPVRHVHDFEDETVILKKGEITFYIGDEVIEAKAGDTIFMPRQIPHHYKIRSEKVSALLILTPGNFEAFLKSISTPYDKNVPPPIERELTEDEIKAFVALSKQYGVGFV